MAKRVQHFNGAESSPWHVLAAANAYYALSNAFAQEWVRSADRGFDRMHEAAASATNRILALELYMKAFLVAVPRPVPLEHNLVTLFNALPENTRKFCVQEFDRHSEAHREQMAVRIEALFQIGDKERELEWASVPDKLDSSLPSLLERNKTGFVDSRYLFQTAKRETIEIFRYEYPRLALICAILCKLLERDLANRPHSYKRTFNF
jgi:hypothetical protein